MLSSSDEDESNEAATIRPPSVFALFRPWSSPPRTSTIADSGLSQTGNSASHRCGTPTMDEYTPTQPPSFANLSHLLPSMPEFGNLSPIPEAIGNAWTQIESYKTRPSNDISPTSDDPFMESPEADRKYQQYLASMSPKPPVTVLSETNLDPTTTRLGYNSRGELKTFSNIKAPPEKECKPFKCDHCKKRYAYLTNLYRHKRAKHNNQYFLFECPFCLFKNGRKDNLKSHVEKDHPGYALPRHLRTVPFDPRETSIKPVIKRPVEVLTKQAQSDQNSTNTPTKPVFVIKQNPTPERKAPQRQFPTETHVIVEDDTQPTEIREMIHTSTSRKSNKPTVTSDIKTFQNVNNWVYNEGERIINRQVQIDRWSDQYRFPDARKYKHRVRREATVATSDRKIPTPNLSPYSYLNYKPPAPNPNHEIMWSDVVPYKYSQVETYVYDINYCSIPIQVKPVFLKNVHSHMWPFRQMDVTTPRRSFMNKVQMQRYRETHCSLQVRI